MLDADVAPVLAPLDGDEEEPLAGEPLELTAVDVSELPLVTLAPDAPDASVAALPAVEVAPLSSLPALLVTSLIAPAAVASPPKPEYVCK